MRPSPALIVLSLLTAVIAGLIVSRGGEPAGVSGVVAEGGPLIALPVDPQRTISAAPIAFELPVRWVHSPPGWRSSDGRMTLRRIAFADHPEAALTMRLSRDCDWPVVLRWRDQWRGECLSRNGTRIRAAVLRETGDWHGLEARYPDWLDGQFAPRVARVLASLRSSR